MRLQPRIQGYILTVAAAVLVSGAVSAQPDAVEVALSFPSAGGTAAADLPFGAAELAMAFPSAGGTAAAGPSVPASLDAAKARAAIEGANARWLSAFRSGDSKSLASIYAPDASLFPPTNTNLEGRDSIVEYFGAQRSAGMGDASLRTLDVVCVGDVAYEVGLYGFEFDGGEGRVSGDTGRYFAIWKAQEDGSWRYQVGIWSSNRDATVAATRH
ncbi:MAG: DUF4440 domain-containing protein [Candidatus Binatia bacterium]